MDEVNVMRSKEKGFEIRFGQDTPATAAAIENYVIPVPAISRRTFLAAGAAVGASLLLGRMAQRKGLEASTCPSQGIRHRY